MSGLIDTNILIYASVESFPEYPLAREFLSQVISGRDPYYLTWINIGEYLSFTSQTFGGSAPLLPIEEGAKNIDLLLAANSIQVISEGHGHWPYLKQILAGVGPVKGPFVHDCRIAAIMRENGIDTILTRDTEFRKIPQLKVIDPLVSSPD